MKTIERIVARNIFIAGFQSCNGGRTLKQAKQWFDKTYPIESQPEQPREQVFCPNCGSTSEHYETLNKAHCRSCGKIWDFKSTRSIEPREQEKEMSKCCEYPIIDFRTKTRGIIKCCSQCLQEVKSIEPKPDTSQVESLLIENTAVNVSIDKIEITELDTSQVKTADEMLRIKHADDKWEPNLTNMVKFAEEYHAQFLKPSQVKTSEEIYKWLASKKYQTEYGENGEYKMYFEVDMPKILHEYAQTKQVEITDEMIEKMYPTDFEILKSKLNMPDLLSPYSLHQLLSIMAASNSDKREGAKALRDGKIK